MEEWRNVIMRYAVGFATLFDNELKVEIIVADSWAQAVAKHSMVTEFEIEYTDLESVKQQFWNCDAMIDCVEVPDAKG